MRAPEPPAPEPPAPTPAPPTSSPPAQATPSPPPSRAAFSERLPFDLEEGRGATILLDLAEGRVETLTSESGRVWLSPSGGLVLMPGPGRAWTLLDRATGEEALLSTRGDFLVRLRDDGTALHLGREAKGVDLPTGQVRWNASLPSPPLVDERDPGWWTGASDDLDVLGAQLFDRVCCLPCDDDVTLQAETRREAKGCGLRISAGGSAVWAEEGSIVLQERWEAARALTPGWRWGATGDAYLEHRDPVPLGELGVAYVRVVGRIEGHSADAGPLVDVERAEVVVRFDGEDEIVVAWLSDAEERGMRLQDGSADGRFLVLSV